MHKTPLAWATSLFGLSLAWLAPHSAMAVPLHASPMVAPWVAHADRIGPEAATREVTIAMHLRLRDVDALQALIAAQSTPGSKTYGKYLSPEEFRARFAPAKRDVERVKTALVAMGFTLDHVPASGLFVTARGTVAQVRQAFGVEQDSYRFQGKMLRGNASAPKLPEAISDIVSFVGGLDDSKALMHPMLRRIDDGEFAKAALPAALPPVQTGIPSPFCSNYYGDTTAVLSTAPAPYPQTLPWLLCSYVPAQVEQAYGIDKVTQDGTGVKVGIVDVYASPTITRDANRYARTFGLPQLSAANFNQIVPAGIYKVPADDPCGPQGWYGEETLDIEAVHSVAPGARITYAGDSCTDPVNGALYNLIDNHLVDIVTNSYSYDGESLPSGYISSENDFFMQAAAEGMTVMFSSGDDGDLAAANGIESGAWDSTSPYVTAIGGTSLGLADATGTKQEWGWGDYRQYLANATVAADGKSISTTGLAANLAFYSGSGGGPSLVELAPDYQSGVSYALSGYTHLADRTLVPLEAPHRVVPDISMDADPYTGFLIGETYTISGNPISDGQCTPVDAKTEYCLTGIGGTSLASPLFAGVIALVNQARFAAGKSAVGFVNPALYAMPVGRVGALAPIYDIKPPAAPTALLRGYKGSPNLVRVVTTDGGPAASGQGYVLGRDTQLRTTNGYDNVTGLGVPNVPLFISQFMR